VEFFTSEKEWDVIKEKIKDDKHVSFYAANNEVAIPGTNLIVGWLHDKHG
jgi:hypothetical protein